MSVSPMHNRGETFTFFTYELPRNVNEAMCFDSCDLYVSHLIAVDGEQHLHFAGRLDGLGLVYVFPLEKVPGRSLVAS
jgi:hypothetical protein